MPRTEYHRLEAPSLGTTGEVAVHGHWGRPVLWFPAEGGVVHEFVAQGMLEALAPALDDGRITVCCVPSYDEQSWSASWKPVGDRALAHRAYEDWILWQVVPFIRDRMGDRNDPRIRITTAGPSMGAFHAVLFALRHAHVFDRALGLSGNYEPWSWRGWGEGTEDAYLTDPMSFLPRVEGAHLEHLRATLFLTLVVGSGQWEDTTGARDSTLRLAGILRDKGIPHELSVWSDQWPHDWSSWRVQASRFLPSLV